MKNSACRIFALMAALPVAGLFAAEGSMADKPVGFRFFNNRLVVKPYVSFSYTFDSNIDSTKHAADDSIFLVSPAVDFEWRGERWMLTGSVWYRYNYYCEYNDTMGENSYGESLNYQWTTSKQDEKGWSVLIRESYAYSSQADELQEGGRGVWRDRENIRASAALERRFTDRWHADAALSYSYLDYKNDLHKYAPLYGWSQYSAGIETGYAASKWTDFLLSAGYSRYQQHNGEGHDSYSNDSDSYTVMAGLGTHATEKITYRVLTGVSWLDYGGHDGSDSGWTYEFSGNWRITRQLQWSALGASYYQPNERSRGSAVKVYTASTGLSYLTLGDKLTLTANIAFRYEENVYSDSQIAASQDYDSRFVSCRLGADYVLNRWMSLFGNISWEEEWNSKHNDYDYDRFRGTLGVRFHY